MKQREKVLSIVLLLTAITTSLFFTPWEIRWRLFSYLPIVLLLLHFGILIAALKKPKLWPLFKAYFAVPVVIYLCFVFWIYSAAQKDTSGWGGMFLPGAILSIPVLPFQFPGIVEDKIERKKDEQQYIAVNSGALSISGLLQNKSELSRGEQQGIYRKLSRGDDIPTDALRSLILNYHWAGHSPETEIIRLALSHPNTSVDTLVEFYETNRGSNHCRAIARNPKTPLWILEEMAGSKNDYVRLAAADTGRLSDELIIKALRLSIDSRWIHGRRYVADSEYATHDMLRALMDDEEYVLEGIAANPKAANEILGELANRESSRVRSAVILNPRATEEVVSLAKSKGMDWRIEKALEKRNAL